MRRPDPLSILFRSRVEIERHPMRPIVRVAHELERRRMLAIEELPYVECVNPLDHDRHEAPADCPGRIYVNRAPAEAEDSPALDDDLWCPSCGRIVVLARKTLRRALFVRPRFDAIDAFLRDLVSRVGQVSGTTRGRYRVAHTEGELVVAFADYGMTPHIFSDDYCRQADPVFVVGCELDLAQRIPPWATVFRLLDLVVGEGVTPFIRAMRARLPPRATATRDVADTRPPLRYELGQVLKSAPPAKARDSSAALRITPPAGTRWNQVQMYYVEPTILAIRVPGAPLRRYTHEQFGLAHKRTGEPTKRWHVLAGLCERNGQLEPAALGLTFPALKEHASKLRALLQQLFGIAANPFAECSKARGLRAAFEAADRNPRSVEERWRSLDEAIEVHGRSRRSA